MEEKKETKKATKNTSKKVAKNSSSETKKVASKKAAETKKTEAKKIPKTKTSEIKKEKTEHKKLTEASSKSKNVKKTTKIVSSDSNKKGKSEAKNIKENKKELTTSIKPPESKKTEIQSEEIISEIKEITVEEIKVKKINPIIVIALGIGAIILLCALIIGISYLNKNKHLKYPVVYVADDEVYVGNSNAKSSKIDGNYSKYDTNVIYKHNKTNKFLYLADDTLYEINTSNGKKKKIANNVKQALYTDDDNYVLYVDKDENLFRYRNNTKKIAKNIETIYASVNGKIYFNKNGNLYIAKLNSIKEPEKIDTDVMSFVISDDGNYAIYYKYEKSLYDVYRIKLGTKKTDKVVEGARKIIATNDNLNEFIYTEESSVNTFSLKGLLDDDMKAEDENYMDRYNGSGYSDMSYVERSEKYYVEQRDKIRSYVKDEGIDVSSVNVYYVKNGKKELLVEAVNDVVASDITNKSIIYSKQTIDKNTTLKISSFKYFSDFEKKVKESLNTSLYYSKNGKNEIVIVKNSTDAYAYINNNSILFTKKENSNYNLYYGKISFGKLNAKEVASDLSSKYLSEFNNGYLFVTDYSSRNYTEDLKYVSNKGTIKDIATDINATKSFIKSNNEKKIYFYQNYEDGEGDLMSYNGLTVKTVLEDINRAYYVTDKYMYILSDCNRSNECDLSIYKGSKRLKTIADDVTNVIAY